MPLQRAEQQALQQEEEEEHEKAAGLHAHAPAPRPVDQGGGAVVCTEEGPGGRDVSWL